ncbi:hypothetical protein A2W15_05830 [Candidatus Woesebacteria bacterium RBG_16_41_13]|nr:MAG: hypothetical protein A2W15_05830 [Candidatus Woesebacteria bacterium RBG_16_41_13]
MKPSNKVLLLLGAGGGFALFLIGVVMILKVKPSFRPPAEPVMTGDQEIKLKKFASREELTKYIKAGESANFFTTTITGKFGTQEAAAPSGMGVDLDLREPSRYSQTNIQVTGVDEPDIVKTNGKQIFYSPNSQLGYQIDYYSFPQPDQSLSIIDAFPPENLAKKASIAASGNMLLWENILVIIDYNKITAYDVTRAASPSQLWKMDLAENTQVNTARLLGGEIYLITNSYIDTSNPCPRPLLNAQTGEFIIDCTDIYYPNKSTSSDSLYSILIIDPKTGQVRDSTTLIGSANCVVYVSQNYIYITYQIPIDFVGYFYGFLESRATDLFDSKTLERIRSLVTLDIGNQAKFVELENILSTYQFGLTDGERQKAENELTNRLNDYTEAHKRELTSTTIVRIDKENLDSNTLGVVPGSPLNQFSLDEFNGNLRIATNISTDFFSPSESANDVYVLNSSLQTIGSVENLGIGERIYSVRFVGNVGYVVTFRQIDPFYTIDLSDPTYPKKAGELKIPGFSSYLHPIDERFVLGVGNENSQVKLSLFDVSDIANPREVSKYSLSEGWTEISNNHHAFLLDTLHKLFFVPSGSNAYIFSYAGSEISLQKALTGVAANRAIYIDNYLYILGSDTVTVLREDDFKLVNSLELRP